MKKFVTPFFMAWGMFFALPCPYRVWNEAARPAMLVCFPLVGAMVGCLWAALAYFLRLLHCPPLLYAAMLTLAPHIFTGFMHLDGFMDYSDAILSRRDLIERRRILKDPHTGSFAVISLCVLLLLTFSLFASWDVPERWPCLFLIPVASRAAAALAVLTLRPMEGSSYAGAFRENIRTWHKAAAAAVLAVSAVLPALFFGREGLCAAVTIAGVWLATRHGARQLDGMSGDIAGYALTIGELCGVAALVLG